VGRRRRRVAIAVRLGSHEGCLRATQRGPSISQL
jgi:hypothetical protein